MLIQPRRPRALQVEVRGRQSLLFVPATMEAEARDRRELEEDMREALMRDEFELHYQTVIDVGRASSAAPRRWCAGGIRARPDRARSVHRLAEESGLIMPLGEWILRQRLHRRRELARASQDRGQSLTDAVQEGQPLDVILSAY